MTRVAAHIAVRDGAAYLVEALDSIAGQTRPVDEVVVVDDGSTDGSGDIAEGHRVRPRVVRLPPSGLSAARNAGIAASSADLLAFLDADDLWLPGHIETLAASLASDPGLAMAFGHVEQFASPDLSPEERARIDVPEGLQPGYLAGAMLLRRSGFAAAGGFDSTYRAGDFIAWFLRARDAGLRHVVLPDLVLRRRLHRSNMGRAHTDFRVDYVRLLRAALHRRRAAEGDS
ncbi:MAG: glycosyltransferase [Alphaproteobacteria bacterium]|nr:glycosyltransferase [Alphaproteobacteria bacterium]